MNLALNINIFLWYIMPGINGLFFVFILPLAVCDFDLFREMSASAPVIGFLIASLVLGFLMDSMKIYQFTLGYKKCKRSFFISLARALGNQAPSDEPEVLYERGKAVFNGVRVMQTEEEAKFPFWEHSRWVMVNHTSKMAFLAAGVWCYLTFNTWRQPIKILGKYLLTSGQTHVLLAAIGISFFVVATRLARESKKIMADSNLSYLEYVKKNAQSLQSKAAAGGP